MDVKRCFLLSLVLALAAVSAAQLSPHAQAQARFREWNAALESVAVDFVAVPKGDDIQSLAAYLVEHGYWEEPVLYDPWGNFYRFFSDGRHYTFSSLGSDGKLGTADDLTAHGAVFEPLILPKENPEFPPTSSISFPSPRSTGDSLRLSKSGNDIIFSWSGAGPTYDVAGASDPRFLNSYLLQGALPSSPYTYTSALTNPKSVEFFDVTEPTEANHAQDANDLYPPTPPSLSSTSGTWYIGGPVTISGSAFSELYLDSLVCFPGGYCIHPDNTSTTTQLSLKVPPGALSGSISTGIGLLESNKLSVDISLEDPALSAMIIRSFGFAPGIGDYYSAVSEGGTNKIMQHYFNAGTGKWARVDRTGSYTLLHYGPPAADASGNMFFGQVAQSTSAAGTRKVVTNPPTNAANCYSIPSPIPGTDSVRVVGIAADPNPEGIAGRNMFYALFEDVTASLKYVKQMYTDCSGIADGDWGNQSGSWNWNALNGAAVDPKTGDLYVAEKTAVRVVRFATETVENFKSGFATNIYNIAVWRAPGNDFGFLLVADTGAAQVRAVPLDNPTAAPLTLSPAASSRAVCTGLTTYDISTYQASDLIRLLVAHNDGSTVKLRKPPYFSTDPADGIPVNIWVSSPEPTDKPTYQGVVKPSYQGGATYSTVRMKAWFSDGVARAMCAMAGDAQSTAPNETIATPNPSCCKNPMYDPLSPSTPCPDFYCDNIGSFSDAGVGTSTTTNDFVDCRTGCGTPSNPCTFEFRISGGQSGDNYRYYLMPYQSRTVLGSALATAWKRGVIQQDQMCKYGGLLFDNFDCQNCAPNCNKIRVYSWTNVALNDPIIVFDESNPFLTAGETRTVIGKTVNGDGTTTLTLDSDLTKNHLASDKDISNPPNLIPLFSNGHSAGFCIPGAGFYKADSSQLNRRLKTGPFDDAFVQFVAPKATAGVVPYLPMLDFSTGLAYTNSFRFHQAWFYPKRPKSCTIGPPLDQVACDNCCNWPQNQYHFIGANQMDSADWGTSAAGSDFCMAFEQSIRANCGTCTEPEISNAIRHVFAHEQGHGYELNCINASPPPTDYHDVNAAWCGTCGVGTQVCVMNLGGTLPDRIDGTDRFCCHNLLGWPPFCPSDTTKCGEGIRRNTDPQ